MVTIDEIRVGDEPEAWTAAGFHVDDDAVCRIGHVRVRLLGRSAGKRILSWSLRDLAAPLDAPGDGATGGRIGAIDGIPTEGSAADPCTPATHPNGAALIDHVVLITPDTGRTVAALTAVGLEPRRTRHTDTYGAPFLQTFFRAGEVIVELIGPEDPAGEGPAGFFGLAHTVDDLDATAGLLGEHLGRVKDAVQPGRRIATLRHREVGMSVATAFLSPGPDAVTALDQRPS